ncbi:amidohydrolase [Sulfolobus acidocaldarius SUSAZ]|nr:amidohydrolase [Sulfolobus acidocaldarius SUSAZ]
MKTIIRGGIVLGAEKPLKKIYIGVDRSKIDVVSQEEPIGYEDAELNVGGWDRLVAPGFITLHTYISLYPFRYRIFSGKMNANSLMSTMSQSDVYYFALLGAYHLMRTGVTTVVFSDRYNDNVARAVINVGLKPIIAVPVGCNNSPENWEKEFRILYNRWSHEGSNNVILRLCEPQDSIEVFEIAREYKIPVLVDRHVDLSQFKDIPNTVIALGGGGRGDFDTVKNNNLKLSFTPSFETSIFPLSELKPSMALDLVPNFDLRHEMSVAVNRLLLTSEEAFKAVTEWGYKQLNINAGVFVKDSSADIVVLEFREPPSFPLDYASPYDNLVYGGYNIETVFVNGEAVLDGGVPLNVGLKDVEEAIKRVEEIDKKVGERLRSLEKS